MNKSQKYSEPSEFFRVIFGEHFGGQVVDKKVPSRRRKNNKREVPKKWRSRAINGSFNKSKFFNTTEIFPHEWDKEKSDECMTDTREKPNIDFQEQENSSDIEHDVLEDYYKIFDKSSESTMPIDTAYELLKLDANAPLSSIRRAYLRQARIVHPDRGGSRDLFQRLSQAYKTLMDSNTHNILDLLGKIKDDSLSDCSDSFSQDEKLEILSISKKSRSSDIAEELEEETCEIVSRLLQIFIEQFERRREGMAFVDRPQCSRESFMRFQNSVATIESCALPEELTNTVIQLEPCADNQCGNDLSDINFAHGGFTTAFILKNNKVTRNAYRGSISTQLNYKIRAVFLFRGIYKDNKDLLNSIDVAKKEPKSRSQSCGTSIPSCICIFFEHQDDIPLQEGAWIEARQSSPCGLAWKFGDESYGSSCRPSSILLEWITLVLHACANYTSSEIDDQFVWNIRLSVPIQCSRHYYTL